MRLLRATTWMAVSLCSVCSLARADGKQWLRHRASTGPPRPVGDQSWRVLEVGTTAPKELKLPRLKHKGTLFLTWEAPLATRGEIQLVIYRSKKHGPLDRILIDTDCDGAVTDERAIEANATSASQTRFDSLPIQFPERNGPITYRLNAVFTTLVGGKYRAHISPASRYESTISIGGEAAFCVLYDRNVNGRFGDRGPQPGEGDRIHIGEKTTVAPAFLGKYVRVGTAYYRLEIAPEGTWVKLDEAKELRFGTVRAPSSVTEFTLLGENGRFAATPQDGPAQFPVGTYRIEGWKSLRKGAGGVLWGLTAGMATDRERAVTVRDGQTTSIEIGEPVVASISSSTGGTGVYLINQLLRGRLGEPITLFDDGLQPDPPRVRITNTSGTYSKVYTFEYG